MIDIKRIVENRDEVERALLKRMDKASLDLDTILETYKKKVDLQRDYEKLRADQNSYNDKMASVEKGSAEFKELIEMLKTKAGEVKEAEELVRTESEKLDSLVEVLPNIPDEDVVAGEKENNEVIETYGEKPQFDFEIKDHIQLGDELSLFDFDRAAKMGGAQMAMYRGDGALLEFGLIQFFISEHVKDGFEFILPPHLLTEDAAYVAGQLPKFREDVYWTQDGSCLLPTAETALANFYKDEVIEEKDLPKKLFGYTPCYRREAGSYRANERGLMRMHQFNKVEMFQYTTDFGSEEAFLELVNKASDLVKKLGLHHNIVKLAAGDCSAGMARTYDVEVYLPYLERYIEVSSISNARDYQARRGNMRFKPTEGGKPRFMHTLNASGLATSRLMVAIVETYQNKDGSITVPEVLRKFVGKDLIKKS